MNENILKKFDNTEHCPVRNVMDRIGDKWSTLVLLLLDEGEVLRFNELNKYIGTISQKMLTVTLKTLEADGLINRKVYPQIPPKVEYRLTQRGQSLMPHIHALVNWSKENMDEIQLSRKKYEEEALNN